MIINDHISHIQSLFSKGIASDDVRLEDEHIYHLMKLYRNKLIFDKQNKFYKLSPFNYQTIGCLPLVQEELNDCDCFETGCLVLKSKCEIPKALMYRNDILLKVTTLDGVSISATSITKQNYKKYRKVQLSKFGWFIHNNRLVIVGDIRLKVVSIKGIFEDPRSLQNICPCDDEGNELEGSCFNPLEDEFPIDSDLVPVMYKMIIEDLRLMYSYPEDNENNAKSNEITNDKE